MPKPPPSLKEREGKGSEWGSASRRRQLQTRSSHHGVMPKPPPTMASCQNPPAWEGKGPREGQRMANRQEAPPAANEIITPWSHAKPPLPGATTDQGKGKGRSVVRPIGTVAYRGKGQGKGKGRGEGRLGQGGRGRSKGGEKLMGTTAYGGKGSKGRAANGDRPVGAASCRRDHHTMASCQNPPCLENNTPWRHAKTPTAWHGKRRVGAASCNRRVGAASCRPHHHTMASCQNPPCLGFVVRSPKERLSAGIGRRKVVMWPRRGKRRRRWTSQGPLAAVGESYLTAGLG